jgi:hypothetical protein
MIPESLWRKRAEEAEAALATLRALMPEVRNFVQMVFEWEEPVPSGLHGSVWKKKYGCHANELAANLIGKAATTLLAKLPAEDKSEYATTAAKCHSHEHPAGCGCHDGPPEVKPATAEPKRVREWRFDHKDFWAEYRFDGTQVWYQESINPIWKKVFTTIEQIEQTKCYRETTVAGNVPERQQFVVEVCDSYELGAFHVKTSIGPKWLRFVARKP